MVYTLTLSESEMMKALKQQDMKAIMAFLREQKKKTYHTIKFLDHYSIMEVNFINFSGIIKNGGLLYHSGKSSLRVY